MEIEVKHLLKDHAYQNIPLTFEEAYFLGNLAMLGCQGDQLAQIQSIAILCALHTKATYEWSWDRKIAQTHENELPKNSAEQIAGICAAIFEQDIAKSKFGYLTPKIKMAMDNCGMGGDTIVTANVSTLAAFIAAAGGIAMCKHGSPANADKGRHGSSDFVSLLGIRTFATKAEIENCLETENFGYSEALDDRYKRIHLQTHNVAKLPHMNDIIGPITNPLNPKILTRRVLGVNHLISPELVAEAYLILNQQGITCLDHGLFIRGFADRDKTLGMDELSICPGGTQVAELRDSKIVQYELGAESFGLQPVSWQEISPPAGVSKGELSLKIIQNQITGPAVQMVLANAALIFYLNDPSKTFNECYAKAQKIHQNGLAWQKVLAVKQKLPLK